MSLHTAFQTLADAKVECLQGGGGCSTGLPAIQASQANLTVIVQIVFGIIGAVAMIVVVVGALSMTLAEGDAGKVAKARATVVYALVGLGVSISAEAIIAFVIKNI